MKYRASWVFLGVAAVVVAVLAAAVADPTGKKAVYVGVGAPLALMACVLACQWIWASRQGPPERLLEIPPQVRDDPGRAADHWVMYRLLALEPLDVESLRRTQEPTAGLIKSNIKLAAAVMILPVLAGAMIVTGWVPDLGSGAFLVVVPFALAPFALAWVRWNMSRAAETAGSWLDPLGLAMTAMPQVEMETRAGGGMRSSLTGESVLKGRRRARQVQIALGSEHRTHVTASVPAFEITQDHGRLRAGPGAPEAVARVVAQLAPSDHWEKLRDLTGGTDGITARRQADAENGWMWDLWLCERLAEELA